MTVSDREPPPASTSGPTVLISDERAVDASPADLDGLGELLSRVLADEGAPGGAEASLATGRPRPSRSSSRRAPGRRRVAHRRAELPRRRRRRRRRAGRRRRGLPRRSPPSRLRTHAGSLDDELALLVVHGGLHLAGWDHDGHGDPAAMWARERELLTELHGRRPRPVERCDTMTTVDIVMLAVVVVLTLTAAVLALAETSITRMSRSRAAALAQSDPRGGARVLRIVENLERDLNSVYLSVNIVQTIQSALVGVLSARLFGAAGRRHRHHHQRPGAVRHRRGGPQDLGAAAHRTCRVADRAARRARRPRAAPARTAAHRCRQRHPAGQGPQEGSVRHRGGDPGARRGGDGARRDRGVRA